MTPYSLLVTKKVLAKIHGGTVRVRRHFVDGAPIPIHFWKGWRSEVADADAEAERSAKRSARRAAGLLLHIGELSTF